MTISNVTLNDWYAVAIANSDITPARTDLQLLGETYRLHREGETFRATGPDGAERACQVRYGHVWLCPGTPGRDLFGIPEADQPGRRLVDCGVVRVECSPLRAIENFLDIAHFPFIHTDILGAEPHTEVERYEVDISEDDDEIWATKVRFFQPKAASTSTDGVMADYKYRVPAPMVAVLYKTSPPRPGEWDVIAIFVQPLDEDTCNVWPWMALYDDDNAQASLIQFQQVIFLQDRSILENQIPRRLPLDPRMEVPTRADMTSIAYRRWLKKRGALYGALTEVV